MSYERKSLRNVASVVLTFIELLSIISPIVFISETVKAYPNLAVVGTYFYNSAGGTEVYPGSKNAKIVVEVRNLENTSIKDVQGCFQLPTGFSLAGGSSCVNALSPNNTFKTQYGPGEVFIFRNYVNVEKNVNPGYYTISISVTYTTSVGDVKSENLQTHVYIHPYPTISLAIVDVWWESNEVFPGTQNAALHIRLKNTGKSDIAGGYGKAVIEQLRPNEIRFNLPTLPSGNTYELTLTGVDIPPNTLPNEYKVLLKLNVTAKTEDGVEYEANNVEIPFKVKVSEAPIPKLNVVDSGWVYGISYVEGKSINVYVTLQNVDQQSINSLVAKLFLPKGLKSRDGRDYVVTALNRVVRYGEVFTLTFDNIITSLQSLSDLKFTLVLEGFATYRNAEFWFNISTQLIAKVTSEDILKLTDVWWSYRGSSAEALPTAQKINLNFRIANFGQDSLTVLEAKLKLPQVFNVRTLEGDCLTVVQAGTTCTLQALVDVSSNAAPGVYNGTLSLTYVVRVGSSLLYSVKEFNINLYVNDPKSYEPNIVLSKAWWGATTPSVSYGLENLLPAHIELTNLGRYDVEYVYVKVVSPQNISIVDGEGLCSSTLPAGGVCRLTPYFNLKGLNVSNVTLRVFVTYYLTLYGTYIRFSKNFTITLPLTTYPPQTLGRLGVVSYGWMNNYPVFPNTQNATYIVTLVNRYPYSISAINAELLMPKGFTASKGLHTAYVAGPIPPNQVVQLSYTLNVGNVSPGTYEAQLIIYYLILSGGEGLGATEVLKIPIQVNSYVAGIQLVTTSWVGRPAEPGTYGNILIVVLRNVDFPQISSVVADVLLPNGIIASLNNESVVKLPASSTPVLPQQLQTQIPPQIQELLRGTQQLQMKTQFNKGDFIYFTLQLNVLNVSPGTYEALFNISFIDHWGNLRFYEVRVPVNVLGAPILIMVWSDDSLNFKNSRVVNMTVKLLNLGSSPAYNVYLAVYPYGIYTLLPKSTPIYIDRLPPNEVKVVKVPVYLNPLPSAQVPITITYGNIPFIAKVIYTTATGFMQTFNVTFTVSVEPFIKLLLIDVKSSYVNGEYRVSGTIVNVGNAQAQRLTGRLIVGDLSSPEEFIGDLDPSSQVSFSIRYRGEYLSKIKLVLSYRNPYNEVEEVIEELRVTEVITPTTTVTPQPFETELMLRYGVIIATVAFLAVVAVLLYRYLKTHPVPTVRE